MGGPKIVVPQVPASLVRRRALTELLDRAARGPVTTVCAPAGYGKTLLLADWIGSTGTSDKAWLSLDGQDGRAEQFWSGVLAAICAREVVPADSRLRTLAPPASSADAAGFLAELVDALDTMPTRISLVVDDVQHVTGSETMHGLEMLIRHQPDTLGLVLSSRLDPPLPLARLRLQGRLESLRAADLRFSATEAATLLARSGVHLKEHQVNRLVEQTDGWAAGLRLAARSLRRAHDPDVLLADLAGDDHAIADYLVGDVLAGLSDETWEFLTAISVCDEVTAPLAEAVTGRDDAGVVLDALERDNALALAVDPERRWYRIHPLLRTYLRSDLFRRRPETVARLHRAAALWFAAEELPRQALDHATRAGGAATVSALLRDHAVALLLNGDHETVRRALSSLGRDVVAADARLSLLSAATYLEERDLATAGVDLAQAERIVPAADATNLASLHRLVESAYALSRGQRPTTAAVGRRQSVAAYDRPALEAWTQLVSGWALLCEGKRDAARQELAMADHVARVLDLDYLVMHGALARGLVAGLDGDLTAMATAAAAAVATAEGQHWDASAWLALAHTMLGFADLMRLDTATALTEAARVAGAEHPVAAPQVRYQAAVIEGGALFDQGRRWTGLRSLQRARRDLADAALLPELAASAALIECQCAFLLGQHTMARDVVRWARQRLGDTAEVSLLVAWCQLARDDAEAADRALQRALSGSPEPLVPATRVDGWLLKSAAAIRSGRRTIARSALVEAVGAAEAPHLIRPFKHTDPLVRELLLDQLGGFGDSDAFAARARGALWDGGHEWHPELTEREHVVLSQLTSQQSFDELAVKLSVSVNTIKTHVRAIYLKLGVNNRRAAALVARERGLT